MNTELEKLKHALINYQQARQDEADRVRRAEREEQARFKRAKREKQKREKQKRREKQDLEQWMSFARRLQVLGRVR